MESLSASLPTTCREAVAVISAKAVQPAKVLSPREIMLPGKAMDVKALQFSKAEAPIPLTLTRSRFNSARTSQSLKAVSPIWVGVVFQSMVVTSLIPSKAPASTVASEVTVILVRPAGKPPTPTPSNSVAMLPLVPAVLPTKGTVNSFKAVHPLKAEIPI